MTQPVDTETNSFVSIYSNVLYSATFANWFEFILDLSVMKLIDWPLPTASKRTY